MNDADSEVTERLWEKGKIGDNQHLGFVDEGML